jgi:cell division transport system permease protein
MKNKQQSFFDMQFITSCISTTMVLMLLGMVVFFVLSAGNLSVYVRENISFSALLSDDMKETEILKFQKTLDAQPYVKSTTYISKEQALREETEAMGTDPQEFIGYNPFTASIEINLNSAYANADSLAWVEQEIMKKGKVIEIVYPEALIDTVNRNVQKISIILLGLATLLMVISFSLINNTIRLTIYAKRFLIHTMKLVGADWWFIRRPFLVRNLWVGIVSGLLANGLLLAGGYWLVKYEPQLIQIINTDMMLMVMAAVMGFGIVITVLCAYFSINRYLRMKTDTLYR